MSRCRVYQGRFKMLELTLETKEQTPQFKGVGVFGR